jgi:hypothetical protein
VGAVASRLTVVGPDDPDDGGDLGKPGDFRHRASAVDDGVEAMLGDELRER